MHEIDSRLEKALDVLREIMSSTLSIYSVTKCVIALDHLKTDVLSRETEFDEVYAYQQLMDFETARVSAKPERKHRATVHTSTARRSASASVSASTSAYNGSGGDHHGGGGGHSYTPQTR